MRNAKFLFHGLGPVRGLSLALALACLGACAAPESEPDPDPLPASGARNSAIGESEASPPTQKSPPSIQGQPVTADSELEQAARAEAEGRWSEAAEHLDRWAAREILDESWYERRARVAEELGDWNRSIEVRQQLVLLRPDDLFLHIDLADDLQRNGRGQEGRQLLDRFTLDTETDLMAWRAIAQLQLRDGHYLLAASTYERLAADPRIEDGKVLWQEAARLREQGGDMAGALRNIEAALAGVDLSPEEERVLARMRAFQSGQPENVSDAVALLLQHPQGDYRLAGAAYLARGRFSDDLKVFRQALADGDERVVQVSLRLLSERGDENDADHLVGLFQHDSDRVRREAIRAVGILGSEAHLPALLEQLQPEDRARFRAARRALEEITGTVIGVELDPDLEARQRIAGEWQTWWRERGGAERGS